MDSKEPSGESVLLGDASVMTTDDSVVTQDDAVQTTDETVTAPVTSADLATRALEEACGATVDEDYLPGKTRFRDVLCARFELSQLEAEEMVDELEEAGRVRFVRADEGLGWHIDATDEAA